MSDYTDVKVGWSFLKDPNPHDNKPSLAVILFAIIFMIWLFS